MNTPPQVWHLSPSEDLTSSSTTQSSPMRRRKIKLRSGRTVLLHRAKLASTSTCETNKMLHDSCDPSEGPASSAAPTTTPVGELDMAPELSSDHGFICRVISVSPLKHGAGCVSPTFLSAGSTQAPTNRHSSRISNKRTPPSTAHEKGASAPFRVQPRIPSLRPARTRCTVSPHSHVAAQQEWSCSRRTASAAPPHYRRTAADQKKDGFPAAIVAQQPTSADAGCAAPDRNRVSTALGRLAVFTLSSSTTGTSHEAVQAGVKLHPRPCHPVGGPLRPARPHTAASAGSRCPAPTPTSSHSSPWRRHSFTADAANGSPLWAERAEWLREEQLLREAVEPFPLTAVPLSPCGATRLELEEKAVRAATSPLPKFLCFHLAAALRYRPKTLEKPVCVPNDPRTADDYRVAVAEQMAAISAALPSWMATPRLTPTRDRDADGVDEWEEAPLEQHYLTERNARQPQHRDEHPYTYLGTEVLSNAPLRALLPRIPLQPKELELHGGPAASLPGRALLSYYYYCFFHPQPNAAFSLLAPPSEDKEDFYASPPNCEDTFIGAVPGPQQRTSHGPIFENHEEFLGIHTVDVEGRLLRVVSRTVETSHFGDHLCKVETLGVGLGEVTNAPGSSIGRHGRGSEREFYLKPLVDLQERTGGAVGWRCGEHGSNGMSRCVAPTKKSLFRHDRLWGKGGAFSSLPGVWSLQNSSSGMGTSPVTSFASRSLPGSSTNRCHGRLPYTKLFDSAGTLLDEGMLDLTGTGGRHSGSPAQTMDFWKRYCAAIALYFALGQAGAVDVFELPFLTVCVTTWGDILHSCTTRVEMLRGGTALRAMLRYGIAHQNEEVPVSILHRMRVKGVLHHLPPPDATGLPAEAEASCSQFWPEPVPRPPSSVFKSMAEASVSAVSPTPTPRGASALPPATGTSEAAVEEPLNEQPFLELDDFTDAELFQLYYIQLVFRAFLDVRFPGMTLRVPPAKEASLVSAVASTSNISVLVSGTSLPSGGVGPAGRPPSASNKGKKDAQALGLASTPQDMVRADLLGVHCSGDRGLLFVSPTASSRETSEAEREEDCVFFPQGSSLLYVLNMEEVVVPVYATTQALEDTAALPLFGSPPPPAAGRSRPTAHRHQRQPSDLNASTRTNHLDKEGRPPLCGSQGFLARRTVAGYSVPPPPLNPSAPEGVSPNQPNHTDGQSQHSDSSDDDDNNGRREEDLLLCAQHNTSCVLRHGKHDNTRKKHPLRGNGTHRATFPYRLRGSGPLFAPLQEWASRVVVDSPHTAMIALRQLFQLSQRFYGWQVRAVLAAAHPHPHVAPSMPAPRIYFCDETHTWAALQAHSGSLARCFVPPEDRRLSSAEETVLNERFQLPPFCAASEDEAARKVDQREKWIGNQCRTVEGEQRQGLSEDVKPARRSQEESEEDSAQGVTVSSLYDGGLHLRTAPPSDVRATPLNLAGGAEHTHPSEIAKEMRKEDADHVRGFESVDTTPSLGDPPVNVSWSSAVDGAPPQSSECYSYVTSVSVGPTSPLVTQESLVSRFRQYVTGDGDVTIFNGDTHGLRITGPAIGRGGSGIVYKGLYASVDRPVAVKVFIIPDDCDPVSYVQSSLTDVAFYVLLNQLADHGMAYTGRAHAFIVSDRLPEGLDPAEALDQLQRRGGPHAPLCYFVSDLMDATLGHFLTEEDADYDPWFDGISNSPMRPGELFQFLYLQLVMKILFDWKLLDMMLNGELRGDNIGVRYLQHPSRARESYKGFIVAYHFTAEEPMRFLRFSAADDVEDLRFILWMDLGQGLQPDVTALTQRGLIGETVVSSCVEEDGMGRYWPLEELYCRGVEVEGELSREVVDWGKQQRIRTRDDAVEALQQLFCLYAPTYGVENVSTEDLASHTVVCWGPEQEAALRRTYVYRS